MSAGNAELPVREQVLSPRAGKFVATGIVACAGLHVPLLLMHAHNSVVLAALMGIAIVGCLSCIPHFVRGPVLRTWAQCGILSGAMVALHVALMTSAGGVSIPGGHAGHSTAAARPLPVHHAVHDSGWMVALFWVATAIAVIQVLTAASVLRRAGRSRLTQPTPAQHSDPSGSALGTLHPSQRSNNESLANRT